MEASWDLRMVPVLNLRTLTENKCSTVLLPEIMTNKSPPTFAFFSPVNHGCMVLPLVPFLFLYDLL